MESLESYYTRFWKRFRKDAEPWARDNILWGIVVLIGPLLAARLLHRHLLVDWELVYTTLGLYAVAAVIYAAVHVCRVPKKLDTERGAREAALARGLSDYEQKIKERDDAIRAQSEKTKRTPAEQHNYDKLKKCLDRFGDKAAIALRHLRARGSIIITAPGMGNTSGSFVPPDINLSELNWALGACAGEGVVIINEPFGKNERIYEIAKNMDKALEDLLY